MYLEISPRKSGKTRRMFEAVKRTLRLDLKVIPVIVTPDPKHYREVVMHGFQELRRINLQTTMDVDTDMEAKGYRFRFFVDDFDFIRATDLSFLEDAYYVTSPRKMRLKGDRDFLTEIVDRNRGSYHAYCYGDSVDSRRVAKSLLPPLEYQRDFLGEWRMPEEG